MKVGILGSGGVAQALAAGLLAHDHEVMLGTRSPAKLDEWKTANPSARVGSLSDAAAFGELLVLAVKGTAAVEAVREAGPDHFAGKPVIDATNPIADRAPVNGVLSFFTSPDESLIERLQDAFPRARLVKAFNSVGHALMVQPQFANGPPTMFICGNDAEAKRVVTRIVNELGWDVADMGAVEAGRAIEPLCMLWCIPGFARNEWNHAFKLLK